MNDLRSVQAECANNNSSWTELLFGLLVSFVIIERLYMNVTITSGTYNNTLSIVLTISLILFLFLNGRDSFSIEETKPFVLLIGFVILENALLINADINEIGRYVLDISLMWFALKIEFRNTWKIMYFIIIAGAVFTFVWPNYADGRITGFLTTSPTNFGLLETMAIGFLISSTREYKLKWPLILLALTEIYLTYSRSILLVAIALVLYKFISDNWQHKYLRYIMVPSLIILIALSAPTIISKVFSIRSDGNASTTTRVFLIQNLFGEFLHSTILAKMFGHGAGKSYLFIQELVGSKLPPHFDVLVWLYDCGIVGFGLVINMIVKATKMSKFVFPVSMLAVGIFHNLLFFPVGLMLLFLSWGTLLNE